MRDEFQIGSVHDPLWCVTWTIGRNSTVVCISVWTRHASGEFSNNILFCKKKRGLVYATQRDRRDGPPKQVWCSSQATTSSSTFWNSRNISIWATHVHSSSFTPKAVISHPTTAIPQRPPLVVARCPSQTRTRNSRVFHRVIILSFVSYGILTFTIFVSLSLIHLVIYCRLCQWMIYYILWYLLLATSFVFM